MIAPQWSHVIAGFLQLDDNIKHTFAVIPPVDVITQKIKPILVAQVQSFK
jgi:hypothetical protein